MPDVLDLPSYAGRLFGVPLLIQQQKLDTILSVLGPKLGLDNSRISPSVDVPEKTALHGQVSGEDKSYKVTEEGIAIIPVTGTLVKRSGGLRAISGLSSYQSIEHMVLDAATDNSVKGIILDVDSNGGEVSGVFDLADAIAEIRSLKPIWSVANDAMYSAAYALGSAAEKIYVTRTGGVGSIGVVALHLDQSGFDKNLGLKYTYIHAGERKVAGNPHEPLADETRSEFQAEIDRLYDIFVGTVANNRGISEEAVRKTEARTFDGATAIALGLADKIGTLDQALENMKSHLSKKQNLFTPTGQTGRLAQGTTISKKETVMPDEKPTGGADAPEQVSTDKQASVDLEKIRKDAKASGRDSALAYVNEINQICALAGEPDKAKDFIAANTSAADVRTALIDLQADQDAARSVSGSHLGQTADVDTPTINTADIYARRKQAMNGGMRNA